MPAPATLAGTYTGRQAMDRLKCSNTHLLKLAAMKELRIFVRPGAPLRYVVEDVERLAARAEEQAR